jgi:hypothetical protein
MSSGIPAPSQSEGANLLRPSTFTMPAPTTPRQKLNAGHWLPLSPTTLGNIGMQCLEMCVGNIVLRSPCMQ